MDNLNQNTLLNEINNPLLFEWKQPIPLENKQLPIFDSGIFPAWLKDYVNGVAEETQTPVDAAAMACISLLSTILGGKYVVKPNETSWTEILSIYSVVALDPANRKSAVYSLFQRPLSAFEKEERERLAPIIADEKTEQKAIKKRINELENKYSKENDHEKAELILDEIKELEKEINEESNLKSRYPRFFTSDVTPEKLVELMYENNGRFAILSSEGAELFDMISGRYSDKFNLDIYLKAFSGDNVTIDRKNSPSILLENPTLTIGLFVQPSVIQNLPVKFSERGLMQRFLFYLPKSFIGNRKIMPVPISSNLEEKFNSNIRKLLELNQSNSNESIELKFNTDATNYLISIQTEIEFMLRNQDLNVGLKGWLGKLTGQIVRIAGLLHIAEYVQFGEIPREINKYTLKKSDSLRDYFYQHAESAFGIIGESESIDDLKYILGKIISKKFEGKEQIDYQELWQLVKKRFKKSEECKKTLILLEEMNYIKNRKDGRKQVIFVNPCLQNGSRIPLMARNHSHIKALK